MTTQIVLLRAINLAGRNRVGMAELRELVTGLGFEDVRTLLHSGNLVFGGDARDGARVERKLESAFQKQLGFATDFFVRSAQEWKAIVAGNPFPEEAAKDPGRLLVMCFKDAPDSNAIAALQSAIRGREVVRVCGRDGYLVYPDGIGR